MTDGEKLAYEEGRLAATIADAKCPYPAGSAEQRAWQEGYGYVEEEGRVGEPND